MKKFEKINQSEKPLIGSNIKRLRELNDLRNVDVIAKLQLAGIKVNASTLSKIERGASNPNVDMLIAMTKIFRCDYKDFFFVEAEETDTE